MQNMWMSCLFIPLLLKNFVGLGHFEGLLSQDQNSFWFIYLFSKETPLGAWLWHHNSGISSPFPVPWDVWGGKKQGKDFVLAALLWVTFAVWSGGFELQVQGWGARRGFVFRVCLSLRDRKSSAPTPFLFPLEQAQGEHPSFPQG